MSLKKDGAIFCDQCGNKLDHSIVCLTCGVMYPDYYLVQTTKPPRRQVEKKALFSLDLTPRPARPTYTYTAERKPVESASGLPLKKLGLLVLIILLAVGAGYFYKNKKMEQEFARDYMRALFTIKSGTDLSLETCSKISADWKSGMDAGHSYSPHISTESETKLNRVKDSTDIYMQRLNKPPKKFTNAKSKLTVLYDMYTKLHMLALAPSGSLASFLDSANKSEAQFKSAVKELKENLPPELSAELKIAKIKYRSLKDI